MTTTVRVSQLPVAVVPLVGDELVMLVQSGVSRRCTVADVASGVPFADPTASVGLIPVNGIATTVMRSDAAPALSQAIVPLWTGLHSFSAGLLAAAGSDAAPGIAFIDSPSTGLEWDPLVSGGGVWFVRNGARSFGYGPNSVLFLKPCFQSDGTGLNPSYTFLNSQQTGMFLGASNLLAFTTAGTEHMRISPDGALGFDGGHYGSIGQVLRSNGSAATPSWGSLSLGVETSFVAAAGNNDNVAIATGFSRVLVNTTAGIATFTGITAGEDGQLMVVTNTGPSLLTLAEENAGSLAANQFYGVTDISLPPKGSQLLSYSAGLTKWVMV